MTYGTHIRWRFKKDTPCVYRDGFVGKQEGRLIQISPWVNGTSGPWVDPREVEWIIVS